MLPRVTSSRDVEHITGGITEQREVTSAGANLKDDQTEHLDQRVSTTRDERAHRVLPRVTSSRDVDDITGGITEQSKVTSVGANLQQDDQTEHLDHRVSTTRDIGAHPVSQS